MKLIHDSINIAETDNIDTLKNQVKACIWMKLQDQDMNGFFGDFLRYVDVLDGTAAFYEFDKPGSEKMDWAIMKSCFKNAGDLETIVNYKYAVWRENEGWRCVSSRDGGKEYLWDFFEGEMTDLREFAADVLQKIYDGETEFDSYVRHVVLTFFSRFDDWDQIIQKAKELKSVK